MRIGLLFLLLTMHCRAAIVRVGSVLASNSSSGNSVTASYTPTSGNTVFVMVSCFVNGGGQPSTIAAADGGTNSYTTDIPLAFDGGKMTYALFRASNLTGGAFTYTGTVTGGGTNFMAMVVIEYSGLLNSSPMDGAAVTTTGTFGVGGIMDSGPLTTTHANDLLLSPFVNDTTANGISYTPGSGWSVVRIETAASSNTFIAIQEQIVSSTGTYNSTGTQVNYGDKTGVSVVAYKDAGASAVTKTKVIVQ